MLAHAPATMSRTFPGCFASPQMSTHHRRASDKPRPPFQRKHGGDWPFDSETGASPVMVSADENTPTRGKGKAKGAAPGKKPEKRNRKPRQKAEAKADQLPEPQEL